MRLLIIIIILIVSLCSCRDGLKTGYKGGMHSINDGCGHKIGEYE